MIRIVVETFPRIHLIDQAFAHGEPNEPVDAVHDKNDGENGCKRYEITNIHPKGVKRTFGHRLSDVPKSSLDGSTNPQLNAL